MSTFFIRAQRGSPSGVPTPRQATCDARGCGARRRPSAQRNLPVNAGETCEFGEFGEFGEFREFREFGEFANRLPVSHDKDQGRSC